VFGHALEWFEVLRESEAERAMELGTAYGTSRRIQDSLDVRARTLRLGTA